MVVCKYFVRFYKATIPERYIVTISNLLERQSCLTCESLFGWHGGVRDIAWGSSHACWEAEMKLFVTFPVKEVRAGNGHYHIIIWARCSEAKPQIFCPLNFCLSTGLALLHLEIWVGHPHGPVKEWAIGSFLFLWVDLLHYNQVQVSQFIF